MVTTSGGIRKSELIPREKYEIQCPQQGHLGDHWSKSQACHCCDHLEELGHRKMHTIYEHCILYRSEVNDKVETYQQIVI